MLTMTQRTCFMAVFLRQVRFCHFQANLRPTTILMPGLLQLPLTQKKIYAALQYSTPN